MTDFINVIVHRGAISRGVQQYVTDLATIGLVQQSIWVDMDNPNQATLIAPGENPVATGKLNSILNKVGNVAFHIAVLNDISNLVGEGIVEKNELTKLGDTLMGIQAKPYEKSNHTNVILTVNETTFTGQVPVFAGYQNLILAPEVGEAPDLVAAEVFRASEVDLSRFVAFVGVSVVGMLGLWDGATNLPCAGQALAGDQVRLVRSFYRRIDGTRVQNELRNRVFDLSENPLVRPSQSSRVGRVVYNRNQSQTNREAAEALFAHHKNLFDPNVLGARSEETKDVKTSDALKSFGSRYFGNLVRWPVYFMSGIRDSAAERVNNRIQDSFYGSGSKVAVGGRRVSTGYETTQGFGGRNFKADPAFYQPLWQDYINTCLAMVDGDSRIPDDPSVKHYPTDFNTDQNGSVQIAKHSSNVIPGPTKIFTQNNLPTAVRGHMQDIQLAPYDVKSIHQFNNKLNSLTTSGSKEATRKFQDWDHENSDNFARVFANSLVKREYELQQKLEEQRRRLEYLSQQQAEGATPGLGIAILRWLGWIVFWSAAIFALAWGIGNWTTDTNAGEVPWQWIQNLNEADTSIKAWMFGLWFFLWLILFLTQVFKETQIEHKIANKRRDTRSELDQCREMVEKLEKYLVQIRAGYGQFVSISKIYGSLLEKPFGQVEIVDVESNVPTNNMPESTVLAEANPSEQQIKKIVDEVKGELFTVGWLKNNKLTVFEEGLRVANVPVEHAQLLSTLGEGSGEDLDQVARAMSSKEFYGKNRSQNAWDQVTRSIAKNRGSHQADVLENKLAYRDGSLQEVRKLLPLENAVTAGNFNGDFITEYGRASAGVQILDEERTHLETHAHETDSIGSSAYLIQFGNPGSLSAFNVTTQVAPTRSVNREDSAPSQTFSMPGLD